MTLPEGAAAGLDPGRSKCGLVLTDPERKVIRQALVLSPAATWKRLRDWTTGMGLAVVVVGDGTGSRPWLERLGELLPVLQVDESHTTLEARHRYWELFPPTGWRRLLPEGLRHPPRDWDDVVAQLLLERWLGRQLPRQPGRAADASFRSRPAP